MEGYVESFIKNIITNQNQNQGSPSQVGQNDSIAKKLPN